MSKALRTPSPGEAKAPPSHQQLPVMEMLDDVGGLRTPASSLESIVSLNARNAWNAPTQGVRPLSQPALERTQTWKSWERTFVTVAGFLSEDLPCQVVSTVQIPCPACVQLFRCLFED